MSKKISKKSNKKSIIIVLIIVAILIIGSIILLNVFKKSNNSSDSANNVAIVEKGNVDLKIFGRGILRAANQYEVKSLVKGEVLEAGYSEGDKVEKGDVLFKISTEEVKGMVKGAKIGIERSKNSLKSLLKQKSNLKIIAKGRGIITKLDVKNNDNVSAGQVIGEITDNSKLKIDVYFAKEEIDKIKNVKDADVILENTSEHLKGKVVSISKNDDIVEGGIISRMVRIEISNMISNLAKSFASARINGINSVKSGILEVKDVTSIVAGASGQIISLNKQKGDMVDNGTLIANIKSEDLDKQIESAKLDLKQAHIGLDDAKSKQKSYDIIAPINGTLVQQNKKVGDIIDPSVDNSTDSRGLALIYDLSSMKLTLNVDEMDILKIKKGQKVKIEASAIPDKKFDAVVENVSLQGDASGGITTYPVTIRIDDVGDLIPGMNVTGNIEAASAKDVMTVPAICLQRGNKLFVKDSENQANKNVKNKENTKNNENTQILSPGDVPLGFHAVDVKVGINDGNKVEIKAGVNLGDEVYMPLNNENMSINTENTENVTSE